jgi:RimJ/RimL family protein N-acetyltransferase
MLAYWPISGLRVTTPRVELRWPQLDDLDALSRCAVEGVHDPDFMPFFSQWTDGPPEVVGRRVLQRHWTSLGAWSPSDWTLYLVVVHEGVIVGSQSVGALRFATTREVLVTAWLGRRYQGQGLGKHARAAVLSLAFSGLGADYVVSVIRRGNDASRGVADKLGFTHDGVQVNAIHGQQVLSDRFRLDRATWEQGAAIPAEIHGLEPGLELFGLEDRSGPASPIHPTAELLSGVAFAAESDGVEG